VGLAANEHVFSHEDHRCGESLLFRNADPVTEPFIERLVLLLLDGKALNHKLRILGLHDVEIVGGAGALLATSLLKVGHIDRLGRAVWGGRFLWGALHQILPRRDVDPTLGQMVVDETRQFCFDLVDPHQKPVSNEHLGSTRNRRLVKQRLVELSQQGEVFFLNDVDRIDLQPPIVLLG